MDSETLTDIIQPTNTNKMQCDSDFPSISIDLLKKTNFKVSIFLFFIGIFLFSDVFIENILPERYRDGDCATTTGTMMQLLLFILCYLVIDLLVSGGLL